MDYTSFLDLVTIIMKQVLNEKTYQWKSPLIFSRLLQTEETNRGSGRTGFLGIKGMIDGKRLDGRTDIEKHVH